MTGPKVSILIPALNESGEIGPCLDAVAGQDFPASAMEIVVIDGCSSDGTRAEVERWRSSHSIPVRVIDNPRRRTSLSLNLGLEIATGQFIVRVDARCRIGPDHVRRCVSTLTHRLDVGVVGGGQRTIPRSSSLRDRSIARGLGNRLTTGFSRYRWSARAGAADTVWMGAFRRSDLKDLGGWDPDAGINEDWQLCSRIRGRGMLVWFDPALTATYLPRRSLGDLATQYHRYGLAKGAMWRRGHRPEPRQAVLVAAPPVACVSAICLRRAVGSWPVILVAGTVALLVDRLGSQTAAASGERAGALGVIAVYSVSWWAGVVRGVVLGDQGRVDASGDER